MRISHVVVVLSLLTTAAQVVAQTPAYWTPLPPGREALVPGERRIVPKKALIMQLDVNALRAALAGVPRGTLNELPAARTTLVLPDPQGGSTAFRLLEVPVMHADLQAQYPMIRTWTGTGLEDPTLSLKLDVTPHGLHAMVLSATGEAWYIDPLVFGNDAYYQIYAKRDFEKVHPVGFWACGYQEVNDLEREALRSQEWMARAAEERVGDCQLRTYDMVISCTGEYAQFHGGTVPLALAAIVTSLNRVNRIFERDATLTMVLVANNNAVIFLNAATDPFTNGNGGAMLGENQTTCDNIIGSANYDIGHVFSTGGGGVAYLNSPCNNSIKAGGVTGSGAPVGDPFDIDYVAHEIGHQFGGNHTQNNSCNRASVAAVEVGSGITIMGYAGICTPNVASNSIDMFGAFSMQEMAANITVGTSSTCPATTPSGNSPPTANAGVDRVIPRSTPFLLTGTAADANAGNVLTYSWEQLDNAVATQPPVATNTNGPAWVPLVPSLSPLRYMPNLNAVIANTTPTWEVLSSVGRTYRFRLTVRDNVAGVGCNDQDNMVVTVNAASGPFVVTQPNAAVNWFALSQQTITWNVAGTNAAPVSCANVDILLSVNGGLTYPFTLLTATPNDGSQFITLPDVNATTARIMVRANGNIFYDISNTNFTISAPIAPDYTLGVASNTATACQPSGATYAVQVGSLLGYSSPVTLSVGSLPVGLTASFDTNPVTPGGTSTLTIGATGSAAQGSYTLSLNATSASGPKSIPLTLVIANLPGQVQLVSPANGATGVTGSDPLTWTAVSGAATYTVQIASDPGLTNVLETGVGVTGTTYQPTVANLPSTTYYWSVQAVNGCGSGVASAVRSYSTAACTLVAVNINLDQYGAETTWRLENTGGTVFASGGPYTNVGASGVYPQPDVVRCLPAGCYRLIVNDSFGDGLCCAYGIGSIGVEDQNGIPLTAPASIFTTTVTSTFCVPAPCISTFPYTESFDQGTGLWLQGTSDDMNWTRLSGATPTANTGPTVDHTTGTGSYLYTEADPPNNPSKRAELYGPCFDLAAFSTAQLRFWYHLFGATMGTLNVDVWNGTAWTNAIFTRTGSQGDLWQQATVDLSAFAGGPVRIRFRGITGTGTTSDMAVDDIELTAAVVPQVRVAAQVWLEGPYDEALDLMNDGLRAAAVIPATEPYTAAGYVHVGGGGETTSALTLAVTGNNALVDWVVVELRSTANPTVVLASRSGLVQRDGDVVAGDGVSALSFPVAAGNYLIAIRHRNHLGCMTLSDVALGAVSTTVDFRSGSTATFGSNAQKAFDGTLLLWAGNAVFDRELRYTGTDNDRDPILARIGGTIPTNTVNGFHPEDLNLDGQVKYTGQFNDRDIILQNIGGTIPTNVLIEQLP